MFLWELVEIVLLPLNHIQGVLLVDPKSVDDLENIFFQSWDFKSVGPNFS